MIWRPGRVDRATWLFAVLIVISLGMVTVDLQAGTGGVADSLRGGAQTVFSPIQRVFSSVTRPVVDFFEGLSDLTSLRGENERLRTEVAALERELEATETLQTRVEELEAIVDVRAPGELDTIAASVLSVGISEFDYIRVIDRGSDDGVAVDMPVIDEGGLVGRVVSVSGSEARIKLISDPTFGVAVRIDRTGETGVLTGRGGGPMSLEMFNTDAALVEGDLLVTADGRFPAGIPVARVDTPARSEVGFSLRTTATTTAALTRVDLVKIVVFTRDTPPEGAIVDGGEDPVDVPPDPEPAEGEPEVDPTESTTIPTFAP